MNVEELEPKLEAFVKEYIALCRKHGLALCGCGCCGSPSLQQISEEHFFSRGQGFDCLRFDDARWKENAIKDGAVVYDAEKEKI